MQYGICTLSIVPVRSQPADASEMVTQLLYGEYFKILEERGKWSRIRIAFDSCEGWVSNNQIQKIMSNHMINTLMIPRIYSADLIEFISNDGEI
jgi:gamma-D-glutamyl-L-lysine dipeptidyl-peptidase